MTKKTNIFAAVVFALLTIAKPTCAATVEAFNLDFGNGYTANGTLTFAEFFNGGPYYGLACPDCYIAPPSLHLFYNGLIVIPVQFADTHTNFWGLGNNSGEPLFFFPPSYNPNDPYQKYLGYQGDGERFTTDLSHLPTSFSDFFLNDSPAVSGEVAVVPLPPTLPLFGLAVLALAGFAWRWKVSEA